MELSSYRPCYDDDDDDGDDDENKKSSLVDELEYSSAEGGSIFRRVRISVMINHFEEYKGRQTSKYL